MSSSYLALGYECNHNCICCPLTTYDRLHKQLGLEEIKRRIGLIKQESKEKYIVLSGGETMLHPEFLRILEYVLNEGFYVTVLSNSSKCQNPKFVESLKNIMLENKLNIVTAIHSSNPSVHDKITGKKGSLLETLEGIDNLVMAKIPVTIKHIFNRVSLPSLIETFQYLERHYPPQIGFQFCTMDYSGRACKNIKELFVPIQELKEPVEKLLDFLEMRMSKKRRISFIESPLCMTDPYYWKYFSFLSKGLDTYIAPNTDEKEVSYNIVSECGTFYEPCLECAVRKWCAGTWKSAYAYQQKNFLSPIHEFDA